MSLADSATCNPSFNDQIWSSENRLKGQNSFLQRAHSPGSPGRVEKDMSAFEFNQGEKEHIVSMEKVDIGYHEETLEYDRAVSMHSERTQARRSLAGTVYGPPLGAPPGHYRRPGPNGPPDLSIVRMRGSNFKKGLVNAVIEVLLEEPQIDLRGRETKQVASSNALTAVPVITEVPIIRHNVKRVRLRSPKLLKLLENIAESVGRSFLTSGTPSLVFQYPFKLFVTLEPHIRNKLAKLEQLATNKRDDDGTASERPDQIAVKRISFHRDERKPSNHAHEAVNNATNEADIETLQHLRLLVELFETDLKQMFDLRSELKEHTRQTIAFADLWHLFSDYGQDVTTDTDISQIYRVLRCTGGREPLAKHGLLADLQARAAMDSQYVQIGENRSEAFMIECVSFEFDGRQYGPVQKTFVIRKFEGEKAIRNLGLFPLSSHPDHLKVRERMIKRGEQYLMLSQADKSSHKHYVGLTLDEPREEVDSQIIVDTRMATLRYYTNLPALGVGNLTPHNLRETYEETVNPTVTEGICAEDGCCDNEFVHKDYGWDTQYEDGYLAYVKSTLVPTSDPSELEDEEKLLFPPHVYGFILRSRKWAKFALDSINDVEYTSGFADLILPSGHKETVRALVANHARVPEEKEKTTSRHQTMDLVRGKGKGLVILLHGAPGVGKTSTAECVADSTRRPLFPITCGDIGDTAAEVETNLESSFQLAHKWGCVLLLDEADIFLQKRDKMDIKRNSIVSVFLRALEYYSGILFLTTNRVGLFDPAFRSRIHMSLYYPGLQKEATMQIWKMHLERTQNMKGPRFRMKSKEILKFAKEHYMDLKRGKSGSWNGRQIRNAFQTAIALAEFEAAEACNSHVELGRQHFVTVAQASEDFDKYLRSTFGGQTEADLARLEQTRVDDYHNLEDRVEQSSRFRRNKDSKKGRRSKHDIDSEESVSDSEDSDDEDVSQSESEQDVKANAQTSSDSEALHKGKKRSKGRR